MRVLKVKVISLPYVFQVLYVLCFSWPIYQVSVYRTIGPLVNIPFLDGNVPRRPSYSVYISQLIRFARASSHVTDVNNRNKFLTAKLLKGPTHFQFIFIWLKNNLGY